ncbi:MAG: hypothetical protein K2M56_06135 [Muribaculaceae bacterium]|nr:hypothetical protein [Muribaculaceae bacterium]
MARKPSRSTQSHRRRSGGGNRGKSGSSAGVKILIVILSIAVVAGIGWALWKFVFNTGYNFKRADLDKYVEMSTSDEGLKEEAAVYVDMSDGMNSAYATPESRAVLQSVVNKFAGNNAIKFFGLADSQITPLDMSHTELYNYILNPGNYDKQKAPIEETLKKIVEAEQPALLLTDFEEYKGGVIEQAAYAKQYFIDWLEKGYTITFYKWAFTENGKAKNMFLAVFDDNAERMNGLVSNAVALSNVSLNTFVLGGHDFKFPMQLGYFGMVNDGANYHNAEGVDAVTAVMNGGGPEDYIRYTKPLASADGQKGQYLPLDCNFGHFCEYYPLGVTWTDALKNAKAMQEPGIPEEDLYSHLLSGLYVDFSAQNGYKIEDIEVRTFDMMEVMKNVAGADSITNLKDIKAPEFTAFLKASMRPASNPQVGAGWDEIRIDFDDRFNGQFSGEIKATDLFRANVVISKVSPNIGEAEAFFSWPGNPSLANSVKETLTASGCSPVDRILYTYYFKTLAE